ncbi:hypothetical protein B0H14DRAFT_2680831 [Mycena olivaceomarginata]|nr:hypothetical protein B0H14DRAFT_2680831 [Mycena olivaceomarginata]
MSHTHSPCITASVLVEASPDICFDFVRSGMKQTHWALGSMEREEVEPGLFCGTSLFTYNKLYIRIVAQPELRLVDYYTGTSPASLQFGTSTHVIDSSCVGEAAGNALIVMTTWRHSSTSDADWELKSHFWPTEITLIKARIDTSSATPNRRQRPPQTSAESAA